MGVEIGVPDQNVGLLENGGVRVLVDDSTVELLATPPTLEEDTPDTLADALADTSLKGKLLLELDERGTTEEETDCVKELTVD